MSNRKLPILLALAVSVIILVSSLVPSTAATAGQWRLLSPTEYTTFPASNLKSIFMLNGGTSGKGNGNGWAVGENGLIFFWDGFSWNQATPPISTCIYDSVNFGGPLNPIQNGVQTSSGWTVGICGGAATSLYWSGIGWQNYPVPAVGASEARSVFLVKSASSATDNVIAIAVGNDAGLPGGAIWTWNGVPGNGGGWVELPSAPTTNNLNSVYMTQSYLSTCGTGVQGVAVGDSGTILTDCGTWNPAASPTTQHLYGVAMSSTTSGWAVGASCTIVTTSNGLTWALYSSVACTDSSRTLRSIVLLSSSEGWAVGDSDASGHPTVLHGTSLDSSPQWTQIPVNQVTPTGIASGVGLNGVTFATSGGNLWAVGASGVAAFCQNNCGTVSGSIWSTTTSPLTGAANYQLNSVFMDSDSDGWAVGQTPSLGPYLIQWNGYSWTQAASFIPLVTAPLYGVAMSGSSNAWAVGGKLTTPSTIYFNGNSWNGVAAPTCAPTCILKSAYMISGSETWAVGTSGVIMHSITQGGTFASTTSPVQTPSPSADLDTVFFSDSQNGWAGGVCTAVTANCLATGDPIIIHTATDGGDNWATIFTPGLGLPTTSTISYTITSLFFQDNTHGWAVASSGLTNPTLILFWNGVSWTKVTPITTSPDDDLFGISVEGGTPATDGWAVGQDSADNHPVTLHYDGTSSTWTEMSLTPAIPTTSKGTLLALALRSSTNGLAVGTGLVANTLALILHLDPPGSFQNTVVQQTTVTNVVTTTPSTTSTTSSTSVSPTTSSSTTSTQSTSSSSTSSSISTPTTVVNTSVSTVTVQNTPTTTTAQATSSVSTPMALPAIPGFPWESIIAGIILGTAALAILRRRRK